MGNAARATTTVCSGISGRPTGRIDIRTASTAARRKNDLRNDHRRPARTPAANWAAESAAAYTFTEGSNTVTVTLPASGVRHLRLTFAGNTGWPAGQLSELEAYTS
ncbi:hypothetical protein ACODT3_39170 [Streptomyces sp. 4.24]|uniref:hypothetical protein n=1 Tax=Streptomyces tritrimontium TaxID=3406573 RepID=UPI003BB705DB